MNSSDEIILKWLNEEIKLEPPVKNITKEFSNGYRFAEILYNINEINEKEFNDFSNTSNSYLIKENFILLKKYFQDKFELIIRKEEFNEIMNKDISKAVIILYKLKNSIQKKKINFLNIKEFLDSINQDEIEQKVKNIIENEYFYDIFNKDLLYDLTSEELNEMNNSSKFQFQSTINTYKSSKIQSLKSTIAEDKIDEKPELKFANKKKVSGLPINLLYNRNVPLKITPNKTKSKKEKSMTKLPNIYKSVEYLNPNKNSIINPENTTPFSFRKTNLFFTNEMTTRTFYDRKIKFGNGKSSIAKENKFKISKLTDTLYKFGLSDFQNAFKNTLPEFNPLDDKELEKVRIDLKSKLHIKKAESQKKQENSKKILKKKLHDLQEINFINRDKNPLYKKRLPIGISMEKHNKYLSYQKRLKYAREWKIYHHQRQIEKKMKQFSLILKNIQMSTKKKDDNSCYFFDKDIFLSILDKQDMDKFNKIINKRRLKRMKDFPLIREISLLIIEMTMEIFFYKEESEQELIDIGTYTKLLELFVNNKPMRERMVDAEARLIKERNKDNEEINPDKLVLTTNENNTKNDFKNYAGAWNDDIIMIKEFKGINLDPERISEFFPPDYEPTEDEIDDIEFPQYSVENYIYGDVILELMDSKFISRNKDNETNNGGKWDHINYKISLIGYPFCGKKFIAGEITKKYPNLKIYSVQNILRNYYEQYKTISEPIEKLPKFKSMKPNQIEQLKQEKENKLKEFEPILKMIQPYVDSINQKNVENDNNKELENQNESENEKKEKEKEKDKEKDKEKEKDNNTNNEFIIPNDEVLLNILIYNIEKDFPKLSEEEIKNEIANNQKNISNLIAQKETLQKQIQENKKHNPKDEQTLLNLDKEIQNLKNNSVKGFILVDFPTNLNQCNMLEHYLTGYIDETELPKSQKLINIQSISSLIDFNLPPPENNKIKRAGIDFIINIISKEEEVNDRFSKAKYDPLNDKIYSEYELSQELLNTKDKKFAERLVDQIPYFTKEHFDYYKKEYDDNISKVNLFYNMFGFETYISEDEINLLNIDNDKEVNKTYQEIDTEIIESKNDFDSESSQSLDEKVVEDKKKLKNLNVKDKDKDKEKSIMSKKEEEIKNKIFNFIDINIIGLLLKETDKKNNNLLSELKDDEEKDKIKFEPDNQINEIKTINKYKATNKEKTHLKYILDNFDSFLSDLQTFNIKYEKYVSKFIHFITRQKKVVFERLNLIQKKYRDFLNQQTDKREVIHIFCEKYNSFFTEFPDAFDSEMAINDFKEDIDELNNALWILINIKETVSIKELQEIKNSDFIEFELKKFYKHIKELFLLEAERFLTMINCIIKLHKRKTDESTNKIINLIKTKRDKEKEKEKNKKLNLYKKEFILRNLIKISVHNENNNEVEFENNESNDKNTMKKIFQFFKKKKGSNPVDYLINKNVETIYDNCINLILSQNEKIENLFKSVKETLHFGVKKLNKTRQKTKDFSTISNNTFLLSKENGPGIEDNLKKIIQNEKNKFKYKIAFLRSFVFRYMIIIIQTSIKIFQNIDNWIIKSVTLQSDAQDKVIHKLRSILKEKRLINEEKDIDVIELDAFEVANNSDKNNMNDEENKTNTEEDNGNNIERIYEKLDIGYLLNDYFIDIEIKEDKDNETHDDLNKNKIELKKYKIIIPADLRSKINDIVLSNIGNKLSFKFSENDFHYHIDKFKEVYKKIKLFEVKKDIISEDILYETFIKKYIFNDFSLDKHLNQNNEDNIIEEVNEKQINNNINDKHYINNLPFICKAVRNLSTKNIKKLFSLFRVPSNNPQKEIESKINETEAKGNILDNEQSEKIEYQNFINNAEVFTILSLIGCKVLTQELEKELMVKTKNYIINDTFLPKTEFYRQTFWFEEDFEYLNIKVKKTRTKRGSMIENKNVFKKIERKKTKQLSNSPITFEKLIKKEENKTSSINYFLFNILKDEKGNNINFKEFINVLKISRYVKELEESSGVKYYDIVFAD